VGFCAVSGVRASGVHRIPLFPSCTGPMPESTWNVCAPAAAASFCFAVAPCRTFPLARSHVCVCAVCAEEVGAALFQDIGQHHPDPQQGHRQEGGNHLQVRTPTRRLGTCASAFPLEQQQAACLSRDGCPCLSGFQIHGKTAAAGLQWVVLCCWWSNALVNACVCLCACRCADINNLVPNLMQVSKVR
jgi:hypothetical protein